MYVPSDLLEGHVSATLTLKCASDLSLSLLDIILRYYLGLFLSSFPSPVLACGIGFDTLLAVCRGYIFLLSRVIMSEIRNPRTCFTDNFKLLHFCIRCPF